MRIVGGELRGRPLRTPPGRDVRPTADRVREAVFNALYSLGDVVDGADVVDLFAGSGALGLEALSRGARHATFVERSAAARRVLLDNVERLGVGDRATVVAADAVAWLGAARRRFDVALVDPPYAFDEWATVLDALDAGVVVVESGRDVDAGPRWELVRHRRYGGTVVQILSPRPSSAPSGATS